MCLFADTFLHLHDLHGHGRSLPFGICCAVHIVHCNVFVVIAKLNCRFVCAITCFMCAHVVHKVFCPAAKSTVAVHDPLGSFTAFQQNTQSSNSETCWMGSKNSGMGILSPSISIKRSVLHGHLLQLCVLRHCLPRRLHGFTAQGTNFVSVPGLFFFEVRRNPDIRNLNLLHQPALRFAFSSFFCSLLSVGSLLGFELDIRTKAPTFACTGKDSHSALAKQGKSKFLLPQVYVLRDCKQDCCLCHQ